MLRLKEKLVGNQKSRGNKPPCSKRKDYIMQFLFGATVTQHQDYYVVKFPSFDGFVGDDGKTYVEACENAAEALRLAISSFIGDENQLPTDKYIESADVIFSVDVDENYIKESACMSVKEAARELDVSMGRISQLLSSGGLRFVIINGKRMVTIESINERKENKPPSHRPKKY